MVRGYPWRIAVAFAVLLAFHIAMVVLWVAAGPSRDAFVLAAWIGGDVVFTLIALAVTDRR